MIPTHYNYQRPSYHQPYDQQYSQSPYTPTPSSYAGPAPPPPLFPAATPPPPLVQYGGVTAAGVSSYGGVPSTARMSSYPLPPPPPFIRHQESSSQHQNIAGVISSQSNIPPPDTNKVDVSRDRDLRRRNSGDRDPRLRRNEEIASRRTEESRSQSSSSSVMGGHLSPRCGNQALPCPAGQQQTCR